MSLTSNNGNNRINYLKKIIKYLFLENGCKKDFKTCAEPEKKLLSEPFDFQRENNAFLKYRQHGR